MPGDVQQKRIQTIEHYSLTPQLQQEAQRLIQENRTMVNHCQHPRTVLRSLASSRTRSRSSWLIC